MIEGRHEGEIENFILLRHNHTQGVGQDGPAMLVSMKALTVREFHVVVPDAESSRAIRN